MTTIKDFDLDEEAFATLSPPVRAAKLKIIEQVAELRRKRSAYLEQAANENDDDKKQALEELAENCRQMILPLMQKVGMYEKGRWKQYVC